MNTTITTEVQSFDEAGQEITLTATLPHLTTQLPDGRIGYFQRCELDCLRAAVATLTQTPYDDLEALEHPGPPIGDVSGERLTGAFHEWAFERGERVRFHRETPSGFAIGIAPTPVPRMNHTVVIRDGRLYFNPASGWKVPGGGVNSPVNRLNYVITLEPKGN